MPDFDPEVWGYRLVDGKYDIRWYSGPEIPPSLGIVVEDDSGDEAEDSDEDDGLCNIDHDFSDDGIESDDD